MQTIFRLATPPVVIVSTLLAGLGLFGACNNGKLRTNQPPAPADTRPRDAGLALDAKPADTAAPAACAEEVHKTGAVPVDVLLLLDRSYSTDYVVPGTTITRWIMAREAMLNFLRSPGAAGLNVGLQFFPWAAQNPICTQDADCPGSIRVNCLPARTCTGPLVIGCGEVQGATGPNDCPANQTCKLGQCSVTGRDCFDLSKDCPSGVAGDACKPLPRLCRGYSIFCDYEKYDQLNLDFGLVPDHSPKLIEQLLHTMPAGLNYTGPAVDGSLKLLRKRLVEMPGRRGVLVLITDAPPTINCLPPSLALIGDLMADAYADKPSISTYVLGVVPDAELGKSKPALDEMAMKGGTKAAFIIKPDATDLVRKFQGALDEIRGRSLPCEFTIPTMGSGPIDYFKVNLTFKGESGETRVPYVGRAEDCDPSKGGWYYDVDPSAPVMDAGSGDARAVGDAGDGGSDAGRRPTGPSGPTRVVACEASCKAFKADAKASVEVRYGCKTRGID